ncbi:uncharacterized protein LOC116109988 isoform X1 [Pistacia vera]|uniref:uncharacterized protein LOC116109988 isoform X1 n=1 Tax=Pistacia vera TaxID=55513 RepID=UPI0012637B05|nr:uncharacterized protein LOC116109988 isoform X1 [Pistacia vera]
MANRTKYKTKPPQYICNFKFCLGVSSGYLIMLCLEKKDVSSSYLWLINPVTGHQIQFPCMPRPPRIKDCHDPGIFRSLFASFGSQGFLIMILCKYGTSLQFCISRDKEWKEYHYGFKSWRMLDIVDFYGKIFVLTDYSRIGIFNFRSCDLNFMELQVAPRLDICWGNSIRLVASNDQLFVVDDMIIYRIDLSRMEWVKVNNLGEQALFLGHGDMMCSKLINPTKWGGQANCRYGLFFSSKRCDLNSFNREEP